MSSRQMYRRAVFDGEEPSMVEEEVVPLTRESPRKRTSSMMEAMDIPRDEDMDQSIFTHIWKLCATLLLTCILLAPWTYSRLQAYRYTTKIPILLWQADRLKCAQDLKVSYAQLYLDVRSNNNQTSLCRSTSSSGSPSMACRCQNPTIPRPRGGGKHAVDWLAGFARNKAMAESAPKEAKFVMLGASTVEHWLGKDLTHENIRCKELPAVWRELFGYKDKAIPLGLAGDRSEQLLYRVEHGEIPESLNPEAWFVTIGTDDAADGCSPEAILVGNMVIMLEIAKRKPDAQSIIMSSLLPVGNTPLSQSGGWKDSKWVNERLECLAEASQSLSYFDGTAYFLKDDGGAVNQSLMYDFRHPSAEGARIWGRGILEKLRDLGVWK